MKIVFAGTPKFAVPVLSALCDKGYKVVAVLTQEDKPCGRKGIITPPPVKEEALKRGIKILQFSRVREHVKELEELGADIMITCAYGQILTKEILGIFKGGVWNIHASLLPKYRGASPIQSAILGGETHTGVTVMRTEEKLDCGDMLLVKRVEIGDKTCGELEEELSLVGAEAAVEAVELLKAGNVQLLMQDEAAATYCKKIEKADAKIDFSASSRDICRKIAAFNPAPVAYCEADGGQINIYSASPVNLESGEIGEVVECGKRGIIVKCGAGGINILKAQFAGGKILTAADIANGRKLQKGDRLD